MSKKKLSILLVYVNNQLIKKMSYHVGWRSNFQRTPYFTCLNLNLAAPWSLNRLLIRYIWARKKIDAVVVLHSAFSNSCFLHGDILEFVSRIEAPKAYFVGNEYKLMPEKIALAKELGTGLFITQTADPVIKGMYERALGCQVVSIPHAGLDRRVFYPMIEYEDRPLDLGFRGGDEPVYFGHQDRVAIGDYFQARADEYSLKVDIAVNDPAKRFDRKGYADFLNRCKAQLGTESGTDFFELTDGLRKQVWAYMKAHPGFTMDELWEKFFSKVDSPVPARIISGRVAETAGTKTLQVLFEGHYNGIIEPDEHYIALKKDFSNIDEVLYKFRDRDFTRRVIDNAYELALRELTYERLIDRFYNELTSIL